MSLQPLSHEGEVVKKLGAVCRSAFILWEHIHYSSGNPLSFGGCVVGEEGGDDEDILLLFQLSRRKPSCLVCLETTNSK